jgi:amino acid adenylation domain-containing protein
VTEVADSRSLVTCFEQIAARFAEGRAICWNGGAWSYAELNARANRLAHFLIASGVKPETPVGVFALRSPEALLSFLAILKAGGVCVPLDPAYPSDLIQFYLEDAAIQIVLVDPKEQPRLPATSAKVILLDESLAKDQPEENPPCRTGPRSLAYILFTSGSTGKPKGVLLEHRNILPVTLDFDYMQVSPKDIFLQYVPLTFDVSTFETWAPWLNGACVVVPPAGLTSLRELGAVIESFHVSTLWLTSGLFQLMVEQENESLASVQRLLVGGDILSPIHVERFLREHPDAHLINCYGPTECTVFVTAHRILLENPMPARLPLGRPIRRTDILILDEKLQPTHPGEPGEIVVTGEGVARGYLNRPDLTAQRFIKVTDASGQQVDAYRSGDLARYKPDGNIEFIERMDHQVKINGLRIELDELKNILQSHPQVAHAVVLAVELSGKKHLEAFAVLRPGSDLTARALRDYLAQKIPVNWLPASIRFLSSLPLNANGKVDRAALFSHTLPSSDLDATEAVSDLQDPVEKAIWAIWREILPGVTIRRLDNFFDLGGDSLSAMNMLAQVEKTVGRRLTLRPLLEGGTIAAIAEAARETGPVSLPPLLTCTQAGGSEPPFFFAHGDYLHGGLFCQSLAQKIGAERPFYALATPGFYDGNLAASVDEIATIDFNWIRSVQPKGPYHLGGFCNGAVAIYEVAQRLIRAGETVTTLVMLDPPDFYFPSLHRLIKSLGKMIGLGTQRRIIVADLIIKSIFRWKFQGIRPALTFAANRVIHFPLNKLKQLTSGPQAAAVAPPVFSIDFYYLGLIAAYPVQPYLGSGTVSILLRRAEGYRHPHQISFWRGVIPNVSFDVVVGTHDDLRATLVDVARVIRDALNASSPLGAEGTEDPRPSLNGHREELSSSGSN